MFSAATQIEARPVLAHAPAHADLGLSHIHAADTHGHAYPVDLDAAGRMFRSGLVVVDEAGNVKRLNRQAADMLADGGIVGTRNGRLFIDRASVQRSFETLLARGLAAGHEPNVAPVEMLGIPDRSGAVRYALTIIAVNTAEARPEVLLSIVDFVDTSGPSRSTFSAVFRLSGREAELAELFSQGKDLEEISTTMGVALNTARVHLRRIFLKTNCNGQLALMRLFSRLATVTLALGHLADRL